MKWNKQAKAITPSEWARRVGNIPDPTTRAKVAAIVWWDHFGDFSNGPEDLDAMRAGAEKAVVTPEALAAGLVSVGYPSDVAVGRASDRGRQVFLNANSISQETRHIPGENSVLCVMCEKAAKDMKALIESGVVLPNGSISADWPHKNHNGVVGYVGRAEVQELIDFVLEGGLESIADDLGIRKGMDHALKFMGLNPDRKVA